ncbi:MAG: CPBP family intramembrane metalloprotease [Acidobacteriia bacterium]|nr:CPBP family intramembrane metalloprotease [Terriglobia bacterium]
MVPLALAKHGVLPPLPGWLHYLSAYGPLVAALLVAASTEGRAGLRALGTRLTRWRAGTAWWALAVSPILLYLVAAVAERITQGAWPDARQLGQLNFLPYVGIWSLPLWLFDSGLGEEGGWRGYALPMLQRRLSPRAASLAIAGGWMIWHVPAFFYLPSYEHLGAGMMIGFFLGILCGAFMLTWLANGAEGSALLPIVWHGLFNLTTAPPSSRGLVAALSSTVFMLLGLVGAWRLGRPRPTAEGHAGAPAQAAGRTGSALPELPRE